MPDVPKPWHRHSRAVPIHPPAQSPYRITASSIYAEQVGICRHQRPTSMEMES